MIDHYGSRLRQNYTDKLRSFNDRSYSKFPAGYSEPEYMPYLPLLSIIMKKSSKGYAKWLHSAGTDEVQRSGEEKVLFEDILKPGPEKQLKLILIEGKPGTGKSTLVKELVSRWVKQSDEILNIYKIVIFIQLRSQFYHNITNIEDLFFYEDINMTKLMCEIKQRRGADILWILDGFDELPSPLRQDSSVFVQLIRTKIDFLVKSTVIVTSRHSAASKFYRDLYSDTKHIKIIGFNDTSIQQYVTEYFKNETIVKAFKLYYKGNPMIENMLQVPLTCNIVCLIFNDTYSDNTQYPETLTTLYNWYMRILLKRHLIDANVTDHDSTMPQHLILEVDFSVPGLAENFKLAKVSQKFSSLSKLAFDGVIKRKHIFEKVSNSVDKLSMMDTIFWTFMNDQMNSSSFLHPKLQEYLAAIYLVNNQNEIFTFNNSLTHNPSLKGVLVLYVGLLKIIKKEVDNVTLDILLKYMKVYKVPKRLYLAPVLQHCLYEHDSLIHNLTLEDYTGYTVTHDRYRSDFDNFIQGFLVAYTASAGYNITYSVSFSSLHELQLFNKGCQSSGVMRGKLEIELDKIDSDISEEVMDISAAVVKLAIFQAVEFKNISKIISKLYLSLQSLDLIISNCLSCNLTDHPLLKLNNLCTLSLWFNADLKIFTENTIKLLEDLTAPGRPLKKLQVRLSFVNISYILGLLRILKQNTSLEWLEIGTVSLTYPHAHILYDSCNRMLQIKGNSTVDLYTILNSLPPIELTSIELTLYPFTTVSKLCCIYAAVCKATVHSELNLLPKMFTYYNYLFAMCYRIMIKSLH